MTHDIVQVQFTTEEIIQPSDDIEKGGGREVSSLYFMHRICTEYMCICFRGGVVRLGWTPC